MTDNTLADRRVTDSPLVEADPRSLDDLYSADPLSITKAEKDALIADLRKHRALFAKEDAEAGRQGRSRRPSTYRPAPAEGQLNLKDLGLRNVTIKGDANDSNS